MRADAHLHRVYTRLHASIRVYTHLHLCELHKAGYSRRAWIGLQGVQVNSGELHNNIVQPDVPRYSFGQSQALLSYAMVLRLGRVARPHGCSSATNCSMLRWTGASGALSSSVPLKAMQRDCIPRSYDSYDHVLYLHADRDQIVTYQKRKYIRIT